MKRLVLLFIVALFQSETVWAQQAGPTPPAAGAGQFTLTQDEMQELRAARTAAIQANPDLIAKHNKLLERMRTLEDKVDAAMIKADPTIAPILAKFEANRPHPGITTSTPPLTAPPPAK